MIDIPEPLKWVGTYLFIGDFPEANEDLLNHMAATYDQVAADIQRLANEVIADARALDNVLHGQAADAIIAVLHNIAHGHDTGLTDLAAQLDKAGTGKPYAAYTYDHTKVPKDWKIEVSTIARAFGQPGGATQVVFKTAKGKEVTVDELTAMEILR